MSVPRYSPLAILDVRVLFGCPHPCEVGFLSLQACVVVLSPSIPSSRTSRPIHADPAERPTCSVDRCAIALVVVQGGVGEVGLSIKSDAPSLWRACLLCSLTLLHFRPFCFPPFAVVNFLIQQHISHGGSHGCCLHIAHESLACSGHSPYGTPTLSVCSRQLPT